MEKAHTFPKTKRIVISKMSDHTGAEFIRGVILGLIALKLIEIYIKYALRTTDI